GADAGWCEVRPVGAVTVGLGGGRLAEIGAMAESDAAVRAVSDDGICGSDPAPMRRAPAYGKAVDGGAAQHAQGPPLTGGAVRPGGERVAEIGAMAKSDAAVRVFSDDGICVSEPVLMRRALEYVKAFDGVIAQHAQEPRLPEGAVMHEGDVSAELGLQGWPAVAEEAIIARDVLLAEHVDSRVHICHLSTAGSVDIVRWAKARGINVTAEVCPHHLILTDEDVRGYNAQFKVNPPLRTQADVEAVRAGLAD